MTNPLERDHNPLSTSESAQIISNQATFGHVSPEVEHGLFQLQLKLPFVHLVKENNQFGPAELVEPPSSPFLIL